MHFQSIRGFNSMGIVKETHKTGMQLAPIKLYLPVQNSLINGSDMALSTQKRILDVTDDVIIFHQECASKNVNINLL